MSGRGSIRRPMMAGHFNKSGQLFFFAADYGQSEAKKKRGYVKNKEKEKGENTQKRNEDESIV